MGDPISYLAHMGIVRVLSVPAAMGTMLYLIWIMSAPPPLDDDNDAEPHRS